MMRGCCLSKNLINQRKHILYHHYREELCPNSRQSRSSRATLATLRCPIAGWCGSISKMGDKSQVHPLGGALHSPPHENPALHITVLWFISQKYIIWLWQPWDAEDRKPPHLIERWKMSDFHRLHTVTGETSIQVHKCLFMLSHIERKLLQVS